MFIYYYVHIDRRFEETEPALLRMLSGLQGWADDAYRKGERLETWVGTRGRRVAKTVEITCESPSRGATETWIPVRWEATGAAALFPSMDADLIVAAVGPSLTQIALRGTYRAPFGKVGKAMDRMVLHRLAEASVKTLLDRIAVVLEEELAPAKRGA
jgi:hypothetical protein